MEKGDKVKKTVVVFSGAGLSADSGIPTFRDTNGLWENHHVHDVAEHEAWFRNPEMVLRFYEDRFNNYKACAPHDGHKALAKLEEKFNVFHITQNIDDLLEQAGCTKVMHMHGKITSKKCEWHKGITTLDVENKFICDFVEDMTEPIKLGDKCPKCGGQLRPNVVWFNEAVHLDFEEMKSLVREVKYNDGVFICVGTSLEVYPAGYFVSFFSQVKSKFIVDRKPKRIADYELIEGQASIELPRLVDRLI